MSLPLDKRDFDLFLSHSHADRALVEKLDDWLTRCAHLRVWYDARELPGGSLLATDLQAAISRSRGILLVATHASLERGWVQSEYNAAMDERANYKGFRVVALRVGAADPRHLMKGLTWVDVPESGYERDTALQVLRSLYPGDRAPDPRNARDVYISCSWHRGDSRSAGAVCRALVDQGFRIVGDSPGQKGFGSGRRVERIMRSCGAFVCVIPFRGEGRATSDDKPYKYFIREIDLANKLGLPAVIVADPRVARADGPDEGWVPMETDCDRCPDEVDSAMADLWHEWRVPTDPHYIFFASDLSSENAQFGSPVRHLVERITGMPTVIGNEIHADPIHTAIVDKIRKAFLVLADITDDNVNSCIEAGMGIAAGTNVEILARGRPRRPPFMLRSLQLSTYEDDIEQVGVLHRLVRPFRKRVVNAEL